MAPTSMMVASGAEVTDSISRIEISENHRKLEQTPSETILPPQPSGSYDVDESVRACEFERSHFEWMILISSSFSCPSNKRRTCAGLWHVTLG